MNDFAKSFTIRTRTSYRHDSVEIASSCDDCGAFSGWFPGDFELDSWEASHRCPGMTQCAVPDGAAVPPPKCSVNICTRPATVLVVRERPVTTALRDADYSCWTGRLEMVRCALHAGDVVSHAYAPDADWRFFGDTLTFSPLPDDAAVSA